MVRDRLRENAYHYRGYRGFNTLDRISLAAMGLGGMLLLGGLVFNADSIAGLGGFLLILGFLVLIRAFPGSGG